MSEAAKLKPGDYVHLHNHTQYSLLDGLTKVPALVDRVKELGMGAVSITDHGTMSGAIEFYKAAKGAGVKPIIGMEAYVAARSYLDKDPSKDRQYFHLTLLAMNHQGYQNLMQLATIANLEGFYYRPRIDRQLLQKYHEGLIVLSGCIGGELSDALRQGQYTEAHETAAWYKKIFGDRYYIELQDHGHKEHPTRWDEQDKVNQQLLKIAKELKIPAVVTCDAHYLRKEDQEAHEILLCVQTGAFLSDGNRFSLKEFELHVADPKDVIKRWGKTHPELILNTKEIAERCELNIELEKIMIPTYPTPDGDTEKSLLDKIVWRGLAWRYGGVEREKSFELSAEAAKKTLTKEIIERANNELGVIDKINFNGFFLIVNDFVNWGKDQGIVFGPGRGSTAGSIVAYATRITDLDPLKYDLLFERFLNAERISMPDMDIDIQDSRRDEVINYCIEKYGRERVANIVTFGRMAARNSVRDVARVLQVPYSEADRLAKMIPPPYQGRHTPLAVHILEVPELREENAANEQSSRVFDLAIRLEGTIRSHGVHAAGVIIAPGDLVKFVPLEMAQKGVVATQFSMGPIEDLGLLKIDFLGLSNLTIIKNALRIIKKVYKKDIEIDQIPLDDKKTYELLQRGETTGVFQLESPGMKRYLKQLKPTVFEDIVAMNALYRPGPLSSGLTDRFIARKNGLETVSYEHELMESALKSTYGVMVYQEQVMQIVKDMCGFSGAEADMLRYAVGKKQRQVMARMKDKVIRGAIKNKVERKIAEKLWAGIEGFADYAFNKSHAACYGLIAYQTAYLKANFPDAFMAALMTSDYDNIDRLAIEINECKHMGLTVLPPDINQSFHEFAIVPKKNQIRFGMDAIKNVGHGAVEEILQAREKLGGFDTLEDFCRHVNCHVVNRKALESLIKTGAFDRFGDRGALASNIDNILAFATRVQKEAASGQVDLFGSEAGTMTAKLILGGTNNEHSSNEQLMWERDLMGLYLSHHPLEQYESYLAENTYPINEINEKMDGAKATIGGSIQDIREITTRNGEKMAFIKIADMSGEIELVLFPKIYKERTEIWQRDRVIVARGKLGSGRGSRGGDSELKLLADEGYELTPQTLSGYKPSGKTKFRAKQAALNSNTVIRQRLYIRIEDSANQPVLIALKEKLDGYKGQTEVVLVTGPKDGKQVIKLPQMIDVNEESLRDLASVFGAINVVVK